MSRKELLETAWKNNTDCMLINFFTNSIIFMRRNKIEMVEIGDDIDSVVMELINKLTYTYPLEVRACDLRGLLVLGREKGFDNWIKNSGLGNKIKPMSELIHTDYNF